MKFRLGCELAYRMNDETVFILNLEAASLPRQVILNEQLVIVPDVPRETLIERSNGTRYTRFTAPVGNLSVRYTAEVDLDVVRGDAGSIPETPVSDLSLSTFHYLLPSRFVPSDRLAAYALREFGNTPTGFDRVTAICNWIYDNLEYQRGSSNPETTAAETLLRRAGVCRDFAHLGISFCRALNIPARFVTCYASGLYPGDFHAVFEAYLDHKWWLFDPTRQAELDGLVRIGVGRDAAEAAFATPFGEIEVGPTFIWIERSDGPASEAPRTIEAISNAEDSPLSGA